MRRSILLLIAIICVAGPLFSQKYVYTIKADSVKITNCDSAELIIENHTQGVSGFLFNTGNGRTQFKRGLVSLGNGSYQIGADTLRAWVQGGNSFGAPGIFGTLDNNPVNFYSDNAKRMSLLSNGNFLINDTSDDGRDKLQVNGNIYTGGVLTNSTSQLGTLGQGGSIKLTWGSSDGLYMSFYKVGNTTQRCYFGSAADNRPFDIVDSVGISLLSTPFLSLGREIPPAKLFVADVYNSGLYDFGVGRQTAAQDSFLYDMVIMPAGTVDFSGFGDHGTKTVINGKTFIAGDVGIGINIPTAQLHTTGSVRFAGLTVDSTQTNVVVCDNDGNLYLRSVASLAANDFPRSSLVINGPVKARQLTLRPTGWADYVFDSGYRLPALSEVEHFIQKEHHLPGIASGTEVEKNGIDVGENQTALLKKVEELTLYSIKQEREIDLLKKQIEELRKMIIDK